VFFPPDLPQPFAAAAATYEALAAPDQYPYAGSVLARHVTPRIYEPGLSRAEHLAAGRFTMNWTATAMVYPDRPLPGPLSLARPDWMRAAVPRGIDAEPVPAGRTDQVRWFAPRERVQARHLDPDLAGAPGDETVPALELYLRASSGWQAGSWGGIATGLSRTGADLRDARRLEIWLNDGQAERALRSGRLHIDVGYVSEDGFWPETGEGPETGTFQSEDRNFDGVWTLDEDTGLDGAGSAGPEAYASDYVVDGDSPFPRINGTAANNRWDTEDLNGDFLFGRREGYFTFVIDLASARPEVDVVYDYEDTGDLVAAGIAWRRHSINLDAFIPVDVDLAPNRAAVTHLRLWFDDPMRPAGENAVRLQIAGLRFVE